MIPCGLGPDELATLAVFGVMLIAVGAYLVLEFWPGVRLVVRTPGASRTAIPPNEWRDPENRAAGRGEITGTSRVHGLIERRKEPR